MHAGVKAIVARDSYSLVFERFFDVKRIELTPTTEMDRRAIVTQALGLRGQFASNVVRQMNELLDEEIIRQGVTFDGVGATRYGPGGWQPGDKLIYELNFGNSGVLLEVIKRSGGVSFEYTATTSDDGWEPYLANFLGCPTFDSVKLKDAVTHLERVGAAKVECEKLSDGPSGINGAKGEKHGARYRMTISPIRKPLASLATSK